MHNFRQLTFKMLALVALPFPAFAQGSNDVQSCMGIVEPTARLACFDGLIAGGNNSEMAVTTATPWLFEVVPDTLTGGIPLARNIALRMEPEGIPATEMNIRCMNGRVEGYLVWGVPILPDGVLASSAAVMHLYRTDQNAPVESFRWGISSTGSATFFTNEAGLIRQLTEAAEFVVQVHPAGSTPITAVFDVTGGDEPVSEVLSACGINIERAGKQGIWGIEAQPLGEIKPKGSGTSPSPVTPSATGYKPTKRWQFSQAGKVFYAIVESASGQSQVSLSCVQGRAGISLTLHSPEGWTANVPVSLSVDEQVFSMQIDGSEQDAYLSDNSSLFVSDLIVNAMTSGQSFALNGPAAERMPEGARYFSLNGSRMAIQQMRSQCGL
ncbi:hypothetical protein [Pseudogemmobacter humi]|uniref:Uncharacterized protein n=1 Tax=Pseudogemmobacter humi TaxID=2483812 RepID=A0A3P5X831_9RHOB|nr:hypothetical protein [Pseudogemmobacter humi]VDC26416.1 hypothetical protein XINFAN_01655 [Pseudogemmobacter humi]